MKVRRRRQGRLSQLVITAVVIPLVAMSLLAVAWIDDREALEERAARDRELTNLVVDLTDLARTVRGDGMTEVAIRALPQLGLDGLDGFLQDQRDAAAQGRAAALGRVRSRAELVDEIAGPGTWSAIERDVAALDDADLDLGAPGPGVTDEVVTVRETGLEPLADRLQELRDRVAAAAAEGNGSIRFLVDVSVVSELAVAECVLVAEDLLDGAVDPTIAEQVRELAVRQDERGDVLLDLSDETILPLIAVVVDGQGERQWVEIRTAYLTTGPDEPADERVGPVTLVGLEVANRIETHRAAIDQLGSQLSTEAEERERAAARQVLTLRIAVMAAIAGTSIVTLIAMRAAQAKVEQVDRTTVRLEASERYARSVIDTASEAIIVIDGDGRIIDTNLALDEAVGIDVIGRPIHDILPGLDATDLDTLVNVELALQRHERRPAPVLVSAGETTTPDGTAVVTLFARDISERKSFEAELEHLASHDSLTGLPNRATLLRTIQRARRRAARIRSNVAVLFIDLDGFKNVNDTRGHQVGDSLLQEVALRILEQVRPYDTVGRLGGDELVFVVDDVRPEQAEATAARVLAGLRRPIHLDEEIRIGASIGLAIDDGHRDLDADQLLQEADLAMYRAKRGGRNRIETFDEEMQTWVRVRSDIENGLRAALAEGDGLQFHAQPLVDLGSGRVTAVELLARWYRPDGPVPPSQFVPIAEESGLAIELGRWAIGEACRISRRMSESFDAEPIRVHVNVSGHHVAQGQLADDIAAAMAETGARASGLTIELTESQLLDDLSNSVR
ncbi:MAG: diguanylate cyclase, partial [Actinomycetota bacterium]